MRGGPRIRRHRFQTDSLTAEGGWIPVRTGSPPQALVLAFVQGEDSTVPALRLLCRIFVRT